MNSKYFFYIQNFVDTAFSNNVTIDTDSVAEDFHYTLKNNFNNEQLCELLISTGFIPDLYLPDSSKETLFTKLVEVLVCEWAIRMGFSSQFIKTKASYEDVNIILNNKTIVCDAKTFRLSRSQQAPNAKDFLKLEDIRKWLYRYDSPLGGLITYPDTHEWSRSSDVYQYCTTSDVPTIMLPYKYLALLLHFKPKYNPNSLEELWNYNKLFPASLSKNMKGGNKSAYWAVINATLLQLLQISSYEMSSYLNYCNEIIHNCILSNCNIIKKKREEIIENIKTEIQNTNEDKLREILTNYRIKSETDNLTQIINRIEESRL